MAHASTPDLLAMHGLRLLGTARADALAEWFGCDVEPLAEVLDAGLAAGLVEARTGRFPGFRLTAAGQDRAAALVAAELDDIGGRSAVEDAYQRFKPVNRELLEICTRWQLRGTGATATMNDHADPDYDAAVIGSLVDLHARGRPVVDDVAAVLGRFAGHGTRLAVAVEQVSAGEPDYFTKPMFPSYHSTWFELHEDLLATLGIERGDR